MFRRIVLWFGGMLLFSVAAYFVTWLWLSPASGNRDEFFHSLVAMEGTEALHSYETGGAKDLKRYLSELDRHFRARHYLTDASGHDLVNGADRSWMLRAKPSLFSSDPPVLHQSVANGRYVFIGQGQPRGSFWRDISAYAWIVLVIVLLCYVLALRLVVPIRALRQTVVRFGQGELTVRSNSNRKDEVGELARAFDQMAGRIETLLNAERRLLQDVSHELRSPLARMRFAVELARTTPASPDAFARILKEIDRFTVLLNELLQMTRAEGDPDSRNDTEIDLAVFLNSLAENCRIEAEALNCRVQVTVEEGISWTGDRELLHRAVENVLRNAIRHTERGSAVELEMHRELDSIVIRVRDHGSGVPETELSKLFKPFYRVEVDRSRQTGGTGLGLAIAHRAVRVHGGQINAKNVDPGLVVEIRLPAMV